MTAQAPDPAPQTTLVRATAPALLLLGLAIAGAAVGRSLRPDVPALVFGGAAILASIALLLPSFRRVAAVDFLYENDIFFVAGVLAALGWANLDLASYEATTGPLRFAVNDVLMALFFGIAAKEVFEALLPEGPLGSLRRASLPLVATAGGMAGPVAIYVAGCWVLRAPELLRGWAIPTATDVAFSALVARFVFGSRHPAIPFLLLLAIADDAAGLAILAIAYPQREVRLALLLGLLLGGVVAGLVLNRLLRVRSPWPYVVVGGALSWVGLHEGGLHPALALVPIVPTIPRAGSFVSSRADHGHAVSTLHRFEAGLAAPVSLILGLFGLVNAGVPFGGAGVATGLVLVALVVGKPLGISLAVALGTRLGLEMPPGLVSRDVLVLGVTAGIGFTVALFVATVAFPGPSAAASLDAAKMGALASVGAAILALGLGRALGVERRR